MKTRVFSETVTGKLKLNSNFEFVFQFSKNLEIQFSYALYIRAWRKLSGKQGIYIL